MDLHLIKGKPVVHSDDDLIVSHIAITVSDMNLLRKTLKNLDVKYRTNISVPNPSDEDTGKALYIRLFGKSCLDRLPWICLTARFRASVELLQCSFNYFTSNSWSLMYCK